MSTHERINELQQKLEAKTQLMQDVAHELKNPMTVIRGYASYLSAEKNLSDDAQKALALSLALAEGRLKKGMNLLLTCGSAGVTTAYLQFRYD
jgi:signal transduction histidine kinase